MIESSLRFSSPLDYAVSSRRGSNDEAFYVFPLTRVAFDSRLQAKFALFSDYTMLNSLQRDFIHPIAGLDDNRGSTHSFTRLD